MIPGETLPEKGAEPSWVITKSPAVTTPATVATAVQVHGERHQVRRVPATTGDGAFSVFGVNGSFTSDGAGASNFKTAGEGKDTSWVSPSASATSIRARSVSARQTVTVCGPGSSG